MSFQKVTDGMLGSAIGSADEADSRCTIECIHNANKHTKYMLIEMWSDKTPEEAHDILSKEDVSVTNKKDKVNQLPKIKVCLRKLLQKRPTTLACEPLETL